MNITSKSKAPIIRKGQTKPFVKCSKVEFERRVEQAVVLLGRRVHRSQIHASFEAEHKIGWHQTDVYIRHARKRIVEASGKSKEDHRLDSLNTYLSVVRDPRSKPSDVINAQKAIDDLLGLKSAAQLNVTGNTGPQASGIFILPDNRRDPKPPFDFVAFEKLQRELYGGGKLDSEPPPNGDNGNSD